MDSDRERLNFIARPLTRGGPITPNGGYLLMRDADGWGVRCKPYEDPVQHRKSLRAAIDLAMKLWKNRPRCCRTTLSFPPPGAERRGGEEP